MPDQRRAQVKLAWGFRRVIQAVSAVRGARRAAELLRETGGEALEKEAESAVAFLRKLPMLQSVPGGAEGAIALMGGSAKLAQSVVTHQATSFTAAIDSSSLIFMHAALDDAILQYLSAVADAVPELLADKVAARKIELASTKDRSYAELLGDKLQEYLQELERSSLVTKTDVLLSVLRPNAQELQGEEHQFDRDHLRELDTMRHDVVHRSGLRAIPTIDADIAYMEFLAFTFWALVSLKVPQTFDPSLMTGAIPELST